MTVMLRLLLVAIVALTSQQLVLTRRQAVVAREMLVCFGGGFVIVSVDADGNPVGRPHICPDGVQTLVFAAGPPVLGAAPLAAPARLIWSW